MGISATSQGSMENFDPEQMCLHLLFKSKIYRGAQRNFSEGIWKDDHDKEVIKVVLSGKFHLGL